MYVRVVNRIEPPKVETTFAQYMFIYIFIHCSHLYLENMPKSKKVTHGKGYEPSTSTSTSACSNHNLILAPQQRGLCSTPGNCFLSRSLCLDNQVTAIVQSPVSFKGPPPLCSASSVAAVTSNLKSRKKHLSPTLCHCLDPVHIQFTTFKSELIEPASSKASLKVSAQKELAAICEAKRKGTASNECLALKRNCNNGIFSLSTAIDDSEKSYVAACHDFNNNLSQISLQKLDDVMLTQSPSKTIESIVEQELIQCGRFLHSEDVAMSKILCHLVLKHLLILPEYIRSAYPELLITCFESFERALHLGDNVELSSVINLWSSLIKKRALSFDQSQHIYTLALRLIISDTRISRDPLDNNTLGLLVDFCVVIFTIAATDELRMSLAIQVIKLWIQRASSTSNVVYLLVCLITASVSSCLTTSSTMRVQDFFEFPFFFIIAQERLKSTTFLTRELSKYLVNSLSNLSGRKSHLFKAFVNAMIDLLWEKQLAPAELFLSSIANELLANNCLNPRSIRFESFVTLIIHFVESLHFLNGPQLECSPTEVILAAKTVPQIIYVGVHQSIFLNTCRDKIAAAVCQAVNAPTGAVLSTHQWRAFIRGLHLSPCYDAVKEVLKSLMFAGGVSESLQVKILEALTPILESDPCANVSFSFSLLERLVYASPSVCQTLIPISIAIVHADPTKSFEVLKRIAIRFAVPNTKSYQKSVLSLFSKGFECESSTKLSFVLLLAILVDADTSLSRYVSSIARQCIFRYATTIETSPPAEVVGLLSAVARSNILVKGGLRKLIRTMPSSELKCLQIWMHWFFERGFEELVCLLSQFGQIKIPRKYVSSLVRNINPGNLSGRLTRLKYLAATLSIESTCGSLDPILSHTAFVGLYETLVSGVRTAEIEYLCLSLQYLLTLCHPRIQKHREWHLLQIVEVVARELEKFLSSDSKESEQAEQRCFISSKAVKSSQSLKKQQVSCMITDYLSKDNDLHLTRVITLCGCIQYWTFVSTRDTLEVINLLISLHGKTLRGDSLSCLLVHTVFSILNHHRVSLAHNATTSMFIHSIIENKAELDVLVEVLFAWKWYNLKQTFNSRLIEQEWFGPEAMKQILGRVLDLHLAFRDRARFTLVTNCIKKRTALLNYCTPRIISHCFCHKAIVAQAALEMYARLCPFLQPVSAAKVVLGLEMASRLDNKHIGPFSRLWYLTMLPCSGINTAEFLDALVSAMKPETSSHKFVVFITRSLISITLDHGLVQQLQEKLVLIIIRSRSLRPKLTSQELGKLCVLEALERWISLKYPLDCSSRTQTKLKTDEKYETQNADNIDVLIQIALDKMVQLCDT